MDCKDTLWELFNKTGDIKYYIMLRAIEDDDKPRKR